MRSHDRNAVRRNVAVMLVLAVAAVLFALGLSVWGVVNEDVGAGPSNADGETAQHFLEIDDGGPHGSDDGYPSGFRTDSEGRPIGVPPHMRSDSGESPEGDGYRNRPFRGPDGKEHPGRKRRLRFVICGSALSFVFIATMTYLVWSAVANEFDRRTANSARFTADVAHELKTPLAVMQSMVEHYLRNYSDNAAVERLGADVLEEVSRLKNLVTRLLLLAQSDAGKLPLKRERVDLSALARLLAEDLSLLTGDDTVESKIEEGVMVVADRSFLTQALQNLLSNAAKYNRSGFTISFTLAKDGGKAVVSVSNGVDPLSPPDAERMFDRFYRGETARGSRLEGAGLGLSLAKEVIQSLGGTISASINGDRIVIRAVLPLA